MAAKQARLNKDKCEVFCYDEEKVDRISKVLEGIELSPIAKMFKALSDDTRMSITYALMQEPELCVCDVANVLGVSTATASHHLRHLRSLGIAKSRKEGKLVFYSLEDEHVRSLIETAVLHEKEVSGNER
ncbi:ArsR/SmtB family transcription factor [Sediminibacillus massiliensis]|uniref:ArsR/SmtB family transcription factor n=1 Tax=Sediminibacillus massiliensis TaxID=1926277 RepID=UPI000988556D|nr:metalloregulator ArsR/SmtB family transcription factor [Sediminibacillus massiliensis]